MANTSILAAFERMWQHVVAALGNKADTGHGHNVVSTSADGFAPKRDGSTTKFLRADGTWAVPSSGGNTTTYSAATSTTLGLVKSGTDITVDSSGNVSVNDNSHNHNASNITAGTLGTSRGGTGITSNPSMLTNLGSTSAASVFATAANALKNLGLTATATELNYMDGVTSNVQTQLDTIIDTAIELSFCGREYTFTGTTDWNNCKTNGVYKITSLDGNNAPPATNKYGILRVYDTGISSSTCLIQEYAHDGALFRRSCYDGTFRQWYAVAAIEMPVYASANVLISSAVTSQYASSDWVIYIKYGDRVIVSIGLHLKAIAAWSEVRVGQNLPTPADTLIHSAPSMSGTAIRMQVTSSGDLMLSTGTYPLTEGDFLIHNFDYIPAM